MVPWANQTYHPKWHLNQVNCFSIKQTHSLITDEQTNGQTEQTHSLITDGQTEHTLTLITDGQTQRRLNSTSNNRPRIPHACETV